MIHAYVSLRDGGSLPVRGTDQAAGYDLRANRDFYVPFLWPRLVPTGVSIALQEGTEAQIRPRSGWSLKGLVVTFGTIDADYRGEAFVNAYSLRPWGIWIRAGDKIAQVVVSKVDNASFTEVDNVAAFETKRGVKGFGSTGR